jgi:hypothetical protein
MDTDQEYRDRAAQARRVAESVKDPLIREQLEVAAGDYDEMADQAEEASTKESGDKPRRKIRRGEH